MAGLPRSMQIQLDAARAAEEAERTQSTTSDPAPDAQEQASSASDAPATGHVVEADTSAPVSSSEPAPESVANSAGFARIEARMEKLIDLVTTLQAENAQLRTQLDKTESKTEVVKLPEPQVIDLTPEERKAYSQSLPIIEKVARKLADEMTSPLRKQVEELQGKVNNAETSYANMNEGMFVNTLESAIPDMRKKLASPNWQTYVTSKIPRTNLTVGQALLSAHKARDLDSIKEIFATFELGGKKLSDQAVPGTVKSVETPKQKEQLKFSDRTKFSEDFRKGRIDRKKFDELVAVYDKAEAEGRVNFDT